MTIGNQNTSKSTALVPARAALAKVAAVGKPPEYVRPDEVRRALDAVKDKPLRHALIRGLWLTGARVSELIAARVGDLDLHTKVLNLRTAKRAGAWRAVPLPPNYVGELLLLASQAALGRDDPLFSARRGPDGRARPISRPRAYEIVRDALQAAGVEAAPPGAGKNGKRTGRAHPHALRHGHAMNLVMNGTPLNLVQEQLGHALISTTGIYLRATAEDRRRALERVDW